jgi:pyrroloquinoline quinone biosynthesis protein E
MDRNFRYLSLLKHAKYGLNLPKGSLANYVKSRFNMCKTEIIGKRGLYPSILFMIAARRCNLRCSFCPYNKKFPMDWQEYELTPLKYKKILTLDILSKLIAVCFTGDGEPLLNEDLPELIRLTRKNKHLAIMITNGLLLEECIKDIVDAGMCDIQVSIYDNTREKLSIILPKVSSYIPINMSYVITKSKLIDSYSKNFEDLIDLIRMCKEAGCESFKFNICDPFDSNDLSETIMENDSSLLDEFIAVTKQKLPSSCFTGRNCHAILPSRNFMVYFPNPTVVNSSKRACCQLWSSLNFDANGNYSPCYRIMENGGNVFELGEGIFNAEEIRACRRPYIDKKQPLMGSCSVCAMNSGGFASVT